MPERAIVRVFKCPCGMAFTERDDGSDRKDSAI